MTTMLTRPPAPRPETTPGPLARVRALLPTRADTPGWIRLLAVAAVLVTVVTALVMAADARSTRHGVQVIGGHTAPTVTATEDLYFTLADMDAQLANVLLAGDDSSLAKVRKNALSVYDQRRAQADGDLQQAMTIATDDQAAGQIRELLDRFGQYQALAADTFQLADLDKGAAGQPSARTLTAYRAATGMVPDLLSRAQQLADTNHAVLTRAYQDSEHTSVAARIRIVVLGMLLLATLIGLQYLMRVTLRRRVNPALAATTVLAAALLLSGYIANAAAAHELTIAKHDAFDSLLSLRQARALSYDANADESRFLLDPTHVPSYTQSYNDKTQQLVGTQKTGVEDPTGRIDKNAPNPKPSADPNSLFGQELRNVTFPGEGAAAEQTLVAFQAYQSDDKTLRALAGTDLRAAIALDTGGSNDHFAAYDKTLQDTIEINQKAFDTAITRSENHLSGWDNWLPYAAAALFAVLVLAGVRPRLAEYR
ncbi:hypothetical protein [Nocardia sp. NPDC004722]